MLQLYKVVLDDPVNCEFGYQNTKTPADLSTGVLLYSMPGDNQLSHVEAPHYQRLSQNSNNSFPRSAWECIPPLKSGLCSARWVWVLTLEHGNQSFATASPSVGAAQVGPPRWGRPGMFRFTSVLPHSFAHKTKTPVNLSTGVLLYSMPGDDLLSHGEAPHYHRRCVVSLPSSGWDRVVPTLYGHQAKLVEPLALELEALSWRLEAVSRKLRLWNPNLF